MRNCDSFDCVPFDITNIIITCSTSINISIDSKLTMEPPPLVAQYAVRQAIENYRDGVLDSLRVLEEMNPALAQELARELQAREIRQELTIQQASQVPNVQMTLVPQPGENPGVIPDANADEDWTACGSPIVLANPVEPGIEDNSVFGVGPVAQPVQVFMTDREEQFPTPNSRRRDPRVLVSAPQKIPMMLHPKARAKAKIATRRVHLRQQTMPATWLDGSVVDGTAPGMADHIEGTAPSMADHFEEKTVWPYGWNIGGPVVATALEPGCVSLRDFLRMVRFIEDTLCEVSLQHSSREEGANYYTCVFEGMLGRFKFGVTNRPTTSSLREFKEMGPRMYFHGVSRAASERQEMGQIMMWLRDHYGRP